MYSSLQTKHTVIYEALPRSGIGNRTSIRRMRCVIGIPQVARQIYDDVYLVYFAIAKSILYSKFEEIKIAHIMDACALYSGTTHVISVA